MTEREKNSTSYSLSIAEFDPENLTPGQAQRLPMPYELGERVWRGNFVSMGIKGFAFARGDEGLHKYFLAALQHYTGFDAPTSICHYRIAGGWRILYPAERRRIIQTYHGVIYHGEARMTLPEEEILDEFDGGLTIPSADVPNVRSSAFKEPTLLAYLKSRYRIIRK